MRAFALSIAVAALSCSACGLFLDDFAKGGDAGEDTGSDSDTGTETPLTPCEGVDLEIDECCNVEDSCFYSFFPGECECPTCPWETDCGAGDGGVPDGGADSLAGV
ncbi:MAG: hypothetical protein M0R80_18710 [Proteobacteria bacterium]|nr:hypothetical protein [Pseudomonadota bacterium]